MTTQFPVTGRVEANSGATGKPIVFIVDDDFSFRGFLKSLIERAGWHTETFASATEFLSRPRALAPSCLVLDVGLPDVNGLDVQQRLVGRSDMPIIFITGHADVAVTVRAMKAGAVEFLTKPCRNEVLLEAIDHAIGQSTGALNKQAQMQGLRGLYAALSRRERQVMALVVAGRLNKQVGSELGISEITVKAHRGRMMRKMNARSLPDLVTMAAMLGLSAEPARQTGRLVAMDTSAAAPDLRIARRNDRFEPIQAVRVLMGSKGPHVEDR